MTATDVRVAIAWSGLPFYAARLIRAGIDALGEPVVLIGTRPKVPISGMEEALGQRIVWIDEERPASWKSIGVSPPRVFIHTGWRFRAFNSLGAEVRRNDGRVVSMIDNSDKRSARQRIGAIVFRAVYRRKFWGVWVPGRSGGRLCSFLGARPERIFQGLYGADPSIFTPGGTPLETRRLLFVFAGQLIERKGVRELLTAFSILKGTHPEAELVIAGTGALEGECRKTDGVRCVGFLQPPELASLLREAMCLVLPSREEHWGVVVHEAALSGCALLLGDAVGAADDLLNSRNGVRVTVGSARAIADAMRMIAGWDESRLREAGAESMRLAGAFGPERWAETLTTIVKTIRETPSAA